MSLQTHLHFEHIWTQAKINWGTTFKMDQFCNICGTDTHLETHHIRKINGPTINEKQTFTQNIMKNLNRKQLIVCQECHNKIHSGQYNQISLEEIYDKRTIQIENNLRSYNTTYYENIARHISRKTQYTLSFTDRRIINNTSKSQQIGPPRPIPHWEKYRSSKLKS